MKEINRIALLRQLRVERDNVSRMISGLDPNTKAYLERQLAKAKDDKTESLDYYINKDNDCTHEYGIKNDNGKYIMCLDCGKLIGPDNTKRIFTLCDDSFHGLTGYIKTDEADIESLSMARHDYLELLLSTSVCDSFTELTKKYKLK